MPTTPSASQRGLNNFLAILTLIALFTGLCFFAVSQITGRSWFESLEITLLLICGTFVISGTVVFFVDRLAAGRVLIDCGPHPARSTYRFNALTNAAFGAVIYLGMFGPDSGSAFGTFILVFAVFWAIYSFCRLRIHEHGIWRYMDLIPWEKVEDRRWEDGKLVFRSKMWRLPFKGWSTFPIPEEHRERLDALLRKHCSQAPPEEAVSY